MTGREIVDLEDVGQELEAIGKEVRGLEELRAARHRDGLRGDDGAAQTEGLHLPDTFWTERTELAHIRWAAWSRGRSPDAVLVGVLARIAADVPHVLRLPAIVGSTSPLCTFGILVADTGQGKSTASTIASELVDLVADPLRVRVIPPGSGEGIVDAYFDFVEDASGKSANVQVRHNAFVYVDEGAILTALKGRVGSTTLETLRAMWSGGLAGQHNATRERKRLLPPASYTLGVLLAIQEELTGPLFEDAAAGTPGRFLWARATDPQIPPPGERPAWPGPLEYRCPKLPRPGELSTLDPGPDGTALLRLEAPIAAEVMDADHARATGRSHVNALDAHAGLIRLRVAALLGILDHRLGVSPEDWRLAGQIMEASNRARAHAAQAVARVSEFRDRKLTERHVRNSVEAAAAIERRQVVDRATWIARKVWAEPKRWTRRELKNAERSNRRGIFDDALEHAIAEGWVIDVEEPGQGDAKRRIRPGPTRPPEVRS